MALPHLIKYVYTNGTDEVIRRGKKIHAIGYVELIEYDPGLAAICREVFGDTVLRYTQPQTRLTGHLEGYDPTTAPRFAWPGRLVRAKDEIRRQAAARDAAANAAPKPAK